MDRQDGVHPNEELRDERCDLEQRNRGLRHLRLPVPVRRKDRRGRLHWDFEQPGTRLFSAWVGLGSLWGPTSCVGVSRRVACVRHSDLLLLLLLLLF